MSENDNGVPHTPPVDWDSPIPYTLTSPDADRLEELRDWAWASSRGIFAWAVTEIERLRAELDTVASLAREAEVYPPGSAGTCATDGAEYMAELIEHLREAANQVLQVQRVQFDEIHRLRELVEPKDQSTPDATAVRGAADWVLYWYGDPAHQGEEDQTSSALWALGKELLARLTRAAHALYLFERTDT